MDTLRDIIKGSTTLEDADDTCVICLETIQLYVTGECHHTVCHVCSARMRCLQNDYGCPLCRKKLDRVSDFFIVNF